MAEEKVGRIIHIAQQILYSAAKPLNLTFSVTRPKTCNPLGKDSIKDTGSVRFYHRCPTSPIYGGGAEGGGVLAEVALTVLDIKYWHLPVTPPLEGNATYHNLRIPSLLRIVFAAKTPVRLRFPY